MLRCNFQRRENGGEVPLFAMSTVWLKDGMSSSGTKFPKKLWTEPVKIDLSSTEEILEKLFRKLSWFTMSRRAGNSCLLQSSLPFPCTRILPVVINTVITTNSSSREAVSLSKLMTILSHFAAEWLLSCSFQIILYLVAFLVNRLWYLCTKVVIQCNNQHSEVVNPKHFAEGLYTDRSMDSWGIALILPLAGGIYRPCIYSGHHSVALSYTCEDLESFLTSSHASLSSVRSFSRSSFISISVSKLFTRIEKKLSPKRASECLSKRETCSPWYLILYAISFLLFPSASEPSMNCGNSKLAYYC